MGQTAGASRAYVLEVNVVGKSELQLKRARKAMHEGRVQDAAAACAEALKRDPSATDAFIVLAEIAANQGEFTQALDLFWKAHHLDVTAPKTLVAIAKTLAMAHRLGEARDVARRATLLAPRDADSLYVLGFVFGYTGDVQTALGFLQQAATIAPRNVRYLFELGNHQRMAGDFDAAERTLRRCLNIDPRCEPAYAALVEMRKQTPEDNFLPMLERLFTRASSDVHRSLALGHALAKSHEDLDDPKAAMDSLQRAKAVRRRHVRYDHARDRALFAVATQTFPGPAIVGDPNLSAAPLFVVGMPRSGTTLTDRILSSHPAVTSVGELQTFALLTHELSGVAFPRALQPDALRRAASIDVAPLAARYLREASALAGPDRRFVDKLPFNFLFAGLIHRALPNARIICLRRDPIDVCLSNYRLFFGQGSAFHDYAYDLEDIARYYVMFDRLMAHWTRTLPPERFMSLQYESLVADQETETRRLLAFCGLDWDERCMAFHENGASVATPSLHQVHSPLFSTSIGRWRRHGDALAPMIQILRAAGLAATA